MARFFHALVVAGAAISASSCGGRSSGDGSSGDGDDGGAPAGTGGTGFSGSGGTGLSGSAGTGAAAGSSGTAGTSGANAGGAGTGGSAAGTSGKSGGGAAGRAGTGGSTGGGGDAFPGPGPSAQWNCEGNVEGCRDVLETTASRIVGECPVEPDRPMSEADCGQDERFVCYLAVDEGLNPLLVNCLCESKSFDCNFCTGIGSSGFGEPIRCDDRAKVCACAYTGILR